MGTLGVNAKIQKRKKKILYYYKRHGYYTTIRAIRRRDGYVRNGRVAVSIDGALLRKFAEIKWVHISTRGSDVIVATLVTSS